MLSIKIKFNLFILDHCSSCYINFGVSRRYSFLQVKMWCITVYRLKILEGVSAFIWICTKLICGIYLSLCIWSSLKIMCIAFIVLLLEYSKLFYILLLFCLYIEILAVSSFFKGLIAIKCSESRVETLQIFNIAGISFKSCFYTIYSYC